MKNKKAMIPGLETLDEAVVGQMFQEVGNLMGSGAGDITTAIPQAADAVGVALTPEQQEAARVAYEEEQQKMTEQMGQQTGEGMEGYASQDVQRIVSGSREILHNLNNVYASEDLELLKALRIWKEARLTPEMIRDQVKDDTGRRITTAEAKVLYRVGSELQSGMDLDAGSEYSTDVLQKMCSSRTVKLTPSVRASIEKVGQNLFRTKRANILWKIDMKSTDDGNQVPYLIRIDTVEADDEGDVREGQ